MKTLKLPPKLTRKDFDSDEEYALYVSTEAGEWESTGDTELKKPHWKQAAEHTISGKRTRISLSIPERNLSRLKSLALRRGVPYQTLINEVLHQHVKGHLIL